MSFDPLVFAAQLSRSVKACYRCPGEEHAIPRAVHLARLAAGFPACAECEHRGDIGSLPALTQKLTLPTVVAGRTRVADPTASISAPRRFGLTKRELLWGDGIRGVYRNELDRQSIAKWATAFAAWLVSHESLLEKIVDEPSADQADSSPAERSGPDVIVGHDDRPSSPDLALGVVRGLRRMGCRVFDAGLVPQMVWHFAVNARQAAGGLYITGAGCPVGWTGFELCQRNGIPLPTAAMDQLQRQHQQPFTRTTRLAAGYAAIWPQAEYLARRHPRFHALRPLRVLVATSSLPILRMWEQLFAPLPCRLIPLELPVRLWEAETNPPVDLPRIAAKIAESQAHCGFLIDETGQRLRLIDESGRLVPLADWFRLVIAQARSEFPGMPVILPRNWNSPLPADEAISWRQGMNFDSAAVASLIEPHSTATGLDAEGRVWYGRELIGVAAESAESLACDALLTAADLLQQFSRTDAAVSRVVAPTGL